MEKVRFGRIEDTREPKNTLVTVRKDDQIYFGISRCRITHDKFNKEEGLKLARLRANVAIADPKGKWTIDDKDFRLHSSGLFGSVNINAVGELLDYFNNIDVIAKEMDR